MQKQDKPAPPGQAQKVSMSKEMAVNPASLPSDKRVFVEFGTLPPNARINTVWYMVVRGFERLADFTYIEPILGSEGQVDLKVEAQSKPTSGNVHIKVFCAYSEGN